MKAKDLREKSVEELTKELYALTKERFNLLIQKGLGQIPKAHLIQNVKLNIARIKTILKEKGSKA
jgi:large subunit ribosomal protein L29